MEKLFAGESESCKQLVFLGLVSHKNKSVREYLGNTSASPWLDCEELGCAYMLSGGLISFRADFRPGTT